MEMLQHLDELYPLLKLKMEMRRVEKQIPEEPHWRFCYTILQKLSKSFAFVIHQLDSDLQDTMCVFYLVLNALDTVEDDTSIEKDVKVRILNDFYRHLPDREWHFSCGKKDFKVLMDEFYHVQTAFLELDKSSQEVIQDVTRRSGAGMAKFICQGVETVDDLNEYSHYTCGLLGVELSRLFHASGKEDLASDTLSNSMGVFPQKVDIIKDYLEDMNETPKSRMFWPREIWSKYAMKLEDFKYEENSVKAVQCLNEMITDALSHVDDCLKYIAALRDPAIFRCCAIPQIVAIGTLALCYNNPQVFRGVVKMRRGLIGKVVYRTNSISDVYGAFHDFCLILKSKVDEADPNSSKTKARLESILENCKSSGTMKQWRSYIIETKPRISASSMSIILILVAVFLAYLYSN